VPILRYGAIAMPWIVCAPPAAAGPRAMAAVTWIALKATTVPAASGTISDGRSKLLRHRVVSLDADPSIKVHHGLVSKVNMPCSIDRRA
jgi:hypothetical protein